MQLIGVLSISVLLISVLLISVLLISVLLISVLLISVLLISVLLIGISLIADALDAPVPQGHRRVSERCGGGSDFLVRRTLRGPADHGHRRDTKSVRAVSMLALHMPANGVPSVRVYRTSVVRMEASPVMLTLRGVAVGRAGPQCAVGKVHNTPGVSVVDHVAQHRLSAWDRPAF